MRTKKSSRREFLKSGATAAALVATAGSAAQEEVSSIPKNIQPPSVIGANERVHTAHIGLGAMGMMNLGRCIALEQVTPVAICDLWTPHRDRAVEAARGDDNPNVSGHVYFEEVIDRNDVDVVVVSTPDHWHAVPAIMACDAGKDLYCEKPLATTIREGRAIREAVKHNNTVFQAGTMQRSGEHFQEAVRLVQEGYIGKVAHATSWIYMYLPETGIGAKPDEPIPGDLDWNRYLGWTPHRQFNWNRFIANFRWYLDYSGGFMTDWGVHLIDIILWAMGEEKQPKSVSATGGKYILTDDRDTPDTLDVLYAFDDYTMRFSNRVYTGQTPYPGAEHGIEFFGTAGTLRLSRNSLVVIPNGPDGCDPIERRGTPQHPPHWDNFLECVKSRKAPICNVDVIHNTTNICHMGTSAYVAGDTLHWDPDAQQFNDGAPEATKRANLFAYRDYANGWHLDAPHHDIWRSQAQG